MRTIDTREQKITQAFVALAGELARRRDPLELLDLLTGHCAELLDIESAGVLLANRTGVLHVVAASTAATRQLEAFQAQREQGPCQDCYSTGQPVLIDDLTQYRTRWPQFVPAALQAGIASVHAVPMRLHEQVLGALNLFGTRPGVLSAQDLSLAQALADVASIALVQDRTASDREALNAQLQSALNSRIVLEQAKGLIAQSGDLDMASAYAVLRRYARDHNLRLTELAQAVVSREVPVAALIPIVQARGAPVSRSGPARPDEA